MLFPFNKTARLGRGSNASRFFANVVAVVCVVVCLGWAIPPVKAQQIYGPVTWSVADGGNGHTYEVVIASPTMTVPDMYADAVARGGYLATITSAAENDFVFTNLVNNLAVWDQFEGPVLGGLQDRSSPSYNPNDPTTGWKWDTGEPWSYTNWRVGEPNNSNGNEVVLAYINDNASSPPSAVWNDYPFVPQYPFPSFVVEFVPEPTAVWPLLLSGFCLARSRTNTRTP